MLMQKQWLIRLINYVSTITRLIKKTSLDQTKQIFVHLKQFLNGVEITHLPVLSVLFKIARTKFLGDLFFMRVRLIYRKKGLCICCPFSLTVTSFMTLHSWNLQLVEFVKLWVYRQLTVSGRSTCLSQLPRTRYGLSFWCVLRSIKFGFSDCFQHYNALSEKHHDFYGLCSNVIYWRDQSMEDNQSATINQR